MTNRELVRVGCVFAGLALFLVIGLALRGRQYLWQLLLAAVLLRELTHCVKLGSLFILVIHNCHLLGFNPLLFFSDPLFFDIQLPLSFLRLFFLLCFLLLQLDSHLIFFLNLLGNLLLRYRLLSWHYWLLLGMLEH